MSDNEIHDDSIFTNEANTERAELPRGFEALPVGDYRATATGIKAKQNKLKEGEAQPGARIEIEWTISEGPAEGRKVFSSHNIRNKNPQAVQIGLGEIKQMKIATGMADADDMREVVGRECVLKLGMDKVTPEYPEPKNRVKEFKTASGAKVTADGAAPVSSTAKTVAKPKGPAWANKKKDAEGEAA
jgi:hypothetical protein